MINPLTITPMSDRSYELPRHNAPDLLPADDLVPMDAHKLHNIQLDAVNHNLLFDPAAAPIALAQGVHEDNAQQHNPWIFEHKQPVLGVNDKDNKEHKEEHKHEDANNKGAHNSEEHKHDGTDNEGAHGNTDNKQCQCQCQHQQPF